MKENRLYPWCFEKSEKNSATEEDMKEGDERFSRFCNKMNISPIDDTTLKLIGLKKGSFASCSRSTLTPSSDSYYPFFYGSVLRNVLPTKVTALVPDYVTYGPVMN